MFITQPLINAEVNSNQILFNDSILSHTHGQITQALTEERSLESQSQAIQRILTEAFAHAIALEEQHHLKNAFISELTKANEELLERIGLIGEQHEILKNKYHTLKDESCRFQQALQTMNDQTKLSKKEIKQLKTQADAIRVNYNNLKNEYVDIEGRYHVLTAENTKLTSESTSLKDDFAILEKNYCQLDEENKKYKDDSDSIGQKCVQLEAKYDQLNIETLTLRNNFDKLTNDYSNLQKLFAQTIDQAKLRNVNSEKDDETFNYLKIWRMISKYTWKALPYSVQLLYQYGKYFWSLKAQK